MTPSPSFATRVRRFACLGGGIAAVLLAGVSLLAQPADPQAPKVDPLCPVDAADAQFGSRACAACHNLDPVLRNEQTNDHAYYDLGSTELILLSEGKTFRWHDPHQMAYKALTGDTGKRMGKTLGYPDDPKTWTACLTCHATDLMAGDTLHANAQIAKPEDRFGTNDGVGCVACHGVRAEWQSAHYAEANTAGAPPPWRNKLPDAKAVAGMRDLRNPAVKAQLCASCHVGSAELGREVTHAMYAAGHPTLPPFELATFLEAEPPHWAHPSDLGYKGTFDWKRMHAHPKEAEVQAAREYAAGAVATLRAEAELLRRSAAKVRMSPDRGETIDFARFECTSCHHDLKVPSDRPAKNPPGRPPLRGSAGIPATLVANHATDLPGKPFENADQLDKLWTALQAAAVSKPFGGEAVESEAEAVRNWCDMFLKTQGNHPTPLYDTKERDRLREAIAKAAVETTGDPEASLVLSWGYVTLGGGADQFGSASREEFEKVFPLSVRAKHDPAARVPTPLDFATRQKKVNAFSQLDFLKAFEGLK